jgi:putative transcriptional regulator
LIKKQTFFFVITISLSLSGAAFCAQKIPDTALWVSSKQLSSKISSDRKLAKGKFLVAARKLKDPNFSQTAVLLIEYDPNGAMGVIINQPTEMKLSMVFADIIELQKRADTIFLGGPVMQDQLLLLVRTVAQPEGSLRVFQNVYVASQLKLIKQMIKNEPKGDRFRVYAGYAGWAPGQLNQEVKRGDWHILQADADTVFNKAPSEIWPELIHRSSLKYVRVRGNRLSNNSFPLPRWEGIKGRVVR